MERVNPDRSQALALDLEWTIAPPEPRQPAVALLTPDQGLVDPENGDRHAPVAPRKLPPTGRSCLDSLRSVYDAHIDRLERLRASLKPPVDEPDVPGVGNGAPCTTPEETKQAAAARPVLGETVIYLDRLAHPPLLPPPAAPSFEDAFRRHEPMFHAVFYRKYAPVVRDDAKQEALLALFRKWRKDPSLLAQSSSYVIQAAIYGVSNWRKKGMKVRDREGLLMVDNHGKVAGEPRRSAHERWTDRIDLRLDVGKAVEAVLYQHQDDPQYKGIYQAVQDVRHDVPLTRGQQASGLALKAYKSLREQVRSDLRRQLAEYAPPRAGDLEA